MENISFKGLLNFSMIIIGEGKIFILWYINVGVISAAQHLPFAQFTKCGDIKIILPWSKYVKLYIHEENSSNGPRPDVDSIWQKYA